MYECVCMHVCVPCACLVPTEARGAPVTGVRMVVSSHVGPVQELLRTKDVILDHTQEAEVRRSDSGCEVDISTNLAGFRSQIT